MRSAVLLFAFLLMCSSGFSQDANDQPLGGKTSDSTTPAKRSTPVKRRVAPKPSANQTNASYSPCGINYKSRAEMIAQSNLVDRWFSLGESASKHFWYNPHRTNCDAQTGAVKSWIKEDHKDTDGEYALVLYELKCKTNQIRVKTVIEYDDTGSVLDTNNHPDDPWQDVAPRTAGETIINTVCRRQ
jgi:hypothetical protein